MLCYVVLWCGVTLCVVVLCCAAVLRCGVLLCCVVLGGYVVVLGGGALWCVVVRCVSVCYDVIWCGALRYVVVSCCRIVWCDDVLACYGVIFRSVL